jgi:hypothetical protein
MGVRSLMRMLTSLVAEFRIGEEDGEARVGPEDWEMDWGKNRLDGVLRLYKINARWAATNVATNGHVYFLQQFQFPREDVSAVVA